MLNLKEGEFAVRTARKAIELWIIKNQELKVKDYPEKFKERLSVFTTLHTFPEKELRGCIGYVEHNYPLITALIKSAIAVTEDPRFPVLKQEELKKIIVEVSILTKPELIKVKNPKEYLKKIKIGRDGLIIKNGLYSGLLLPQVPIEQKWNEEEFLENLCFKAGLLPDQWLDENSKIYKFQSQIFTEERPYGKIKEIKLNKI